MKNTWLKFLVAISAIMIAGSAAYFSVTGLGVLFSGAAMAVMIMASSLEFAKLVTATYLKQEWDNIKGFNKWYLTFAVVILMAITSAGIFGYLSNAFQQQNLALQQIEREVLVHSTKIQQNEAQIKQLSTQITESNANQGKIIDNANLKSNRTLRSLENRDKQISKLNDRIAKLQEENAAENDSINKIKTDNIGIEKEVGGFRFVAEAFGVELNSVVKFFIILIVIVFDPLAVALVISFNQLIADGRKKEDEEEPKAEDDPSELKDFVDEASRLHLSEEDIKKLEEVLLNPPFPNEKLKEAAKRYSDEVREKHVYIKDQEIAEPQSDKSDDGKWNGISQEVWDRMEEIEKQREAIHGPILPEDEPVGALANSGYRDMDKWVDDEIDEEPYAGPIPPYINEEAPDEIVEENSIIEPTIEEEDENFSTIEPFSENIFQNETEEVVNDTPIIVEEQTINLRQVHFDEPETENVVDTLTDEYITEAIEEFNQQSIEEENEMVEPLPIPPVEDVEIHVEMPEEEDSENESEKKKS